MPSLNFTVLTEKVERGEKTQTIRPLTSRIRKGDKLYLYTGLRQRRFCTDPASHNFGKEVGRTEGCRGRRCDSCSNRGAKLLGIGVCTDVAVKTYGELTQEDAQADGFEDGYQQDFCPAFCSSANNCISCRAVDKLRLFLKKKHRKAENMTFVVIRWRLIK